jgi:hypothetical protein
MGDASLQLPGLFVDGCSEYQNGMIELPEEDDG